MGTEDSEIENDLIAKSPDGAADQVKSPEKSPEKSPVKSPDEYVRPDYLPVSKCPELTEAVDAVYTWVNGSDPEFVTSLKETDLGRDPRTKRSGPVHGGPWIPGFRVENTQGRYS